LHCHVGAGWFWGGRADTFPHFGWTIGCKMGLWSIGLVIEIVADRDMVGTGPDSLFSIQ